MPISVSCPFCAKALRVKDEWAGRRAKCPNCGETFMVEAAPAQSAAGSPVATAAPRRAGTVYDPVAAAAVKARQDRERSWQAGNAEARNLPWQFVLLGFLYFGALPAGLLTFAAFNPTSGMRDRTKTSVYEICVPYLVLLIGATPFLLRGGMRHYALLNAGRPVQPRGPRLIKWSLCVAMGVVAAFLHVPFVISGGVIIAGLLCITAILVAPDI